MAQTVSFAISAQPLLRRFTLIGPQNRFIEPWEAASRLEYLSDITLRATNADILDGPWYAGSFATEGVPAVGFPALRGACLELDATLLPTIITSISSPELQDIKLRVEGQIEDDGHMPVNSLDSGLDGLGRFLKLTSLHIVFPRTNSDWSDFTPLLACCGMTTIVLRGHDLSIVVGDPELQAMAESWPNVRRMEIQDSTRQEHNHRYDEHQAPRVTILGLSCLSLHCPLLETLKICVDARQPGRRAVITHAGVAMKEVRLPFSWLEQEDPGYEVDVDENSDGAAPEPGLQPVTNLDRNGEDDVASLICSLWPNQTLPPPEEVLLWALTHGDWNSLHSEEFLPPPNLVRPWERIWKRVFECLRGETAFSVP